MISKPEDIRHTLHLSKLQFREISVAGLGATVNVLWTHTPQQQLTLIINSHLSVFSGFHTPPL